MIFALAGNQNSGKTTLFNQLTGANQHVGNFPGVTIDKKQGIIRGTDAVIVDLPGIYSLSPYTNEEIVTRDFLIDGNPDCIINIVDATNIERNLYLSLQLMELNIPMIIALNMMDEVRANGSEFDVSELQEMIGLPMISISAIKNEGIEDLIKAAMTVAKEQKRPESTNFGSGEVHNTIQSIFYLIEEKAEKISVPVSFAATKVLEEDKLMMDKLGLSLDERQRIKKLVMQMEKKVEIDAEAALADMRYKFVEKVCAKVIKNKGISKGHQRSLKIDEILTHKYFGIPIFFGIMLLMFYLTFGLIGTFLSDFLATFIDELARLTDMGLTTLNMNPVIHSLIIDGVFVGVGSVLSFLPIIVVLFFFLSMLEDSGYMARVAFVMDKLLRKIGLSGKSFVPMLIGFGCTVPAVMAARTLSSERDRKMTILLTPFMSCSAKIPIYSIFTITFFPRYRALVMIVLYLMGIFIGIISGLFLNKTLFKGKSIPFVMELPNYRLPLLKSTLMLMWDKAKDFLVKAFTIIFLASIIIWFLQTFDFGLMRVEDNSKSILAYLGRFMIPFFRPIGFGDWRIATALVTGFTAKEAVVSTLAVLMGTNFEGLHEVLGTMFTPLQAFSFLTFTLLYTPCVAAVAAFRREMGSLKATIYMVLLQIFVAWIAAFIVYNVGGLFFR